MSNKKINSPTTSQHLFDILNQYPCLPTPFYLLDEIKIEKNLQLLQQMQQQSGCKILCALKGFAFHRRFNLLKKYLSGACTSGLWEAKLASDIGGEVHTYSPAFKQNEIEKIAHLSTTLVFNSLPQFKKYAQKIKVIDPNLRLELRINPEKSFSPVPLYDPCGKLSRFGVKASELKKAAKKGFDLSNLDGVHFHALCEQGADELEAILKIVKKKFDFVLKEVRTVNFGGGHRITKKRYNTQKLVRLIKDFKTTFPNLHDVYLEPGEAVGWQTGVLVCKVVDIFKNRNQKIAILDTSFEAHMPDTLAMPYHPKVLNTTKKDKSTNSYIFSGNSCLSGDFLKKPFAFKKPLKIDDWVVFKNMIHYSIVKNTTFNGLQLPHLAILKNGKIQILKKFKYKDYKRRN